MKGDEPTGAQIPLFDGRHTGTGREGAEPPHVFTVTELTLLVKGLIEPRFPLVWIEGEVSNYKGPNAAGHIYFKLKDAGATMPAVAFRRSRASAFPLREGLQVVAKGKLEIYPPHGHYQLVVEEMEPKGEGARQLALQQLKERLAREGLFAAERKRRLPVLPRRVGVVTSPTGAVFQDILKVVGRRYPTMPVRLSPATVQGDKAADSVAQALARLDACDDIDVIIVGRGGGAVEDLWAFNEEVVVRAIAACRHPVIAAVGHETDVTLADLVADVRAPTPSAAAEIAVPVRSELVAAIEVLRGRARAALLRDTAARRNRLIAMRARLGDPRRSLRDLRLAADDLEHREQRSIQARLRGARLRLHEVGARLERQHPRAKVVRIDERLTGLATAARHAMWQRIASARALLATTAGRLDALSPLAVLERGYAIAQRPDGSAIRRAREVTAGDDVTVRLGEGALDCRVRKVKP